MTTINSPEHVETLVIGGGQAGLSVGYHLKKRGMPFLVLDANERVGDAWRNRWDSLRLFSPSRVNGLAGMPFPGESWRFPTKDEMGDYLESYAKRFEIPVRNGQKVDCLMRKNGRFFVTTKDSHYTADNVVVAMANHQEPKKPDFADELDPGIVQMHSSEYRTPSQLQDGSVLIVGAGNSGAELAKEFAGSHEVVMSGKSSGELPFKMEGTLSRLFLLKLVGRVVFHRILTTSTPMGRKARRKMLRQASPLIRVKSKDLAEMGVERVPRTVGVRNGKPVLEDGRVQDVKNVVWCTGYDPGFSWIDLPVLGEYEPNHRRGVVESEPGLYFVGLHFLYAMSSEMIHGVGRDAEYIVKAIEKRTKAGAAAA
jgi:putative flavoprotein involved in K+ transport